MGNEMQVATALLQSSSEDERVRGREIVARQFEQREPFAVYAVGTWLLHGANGYPKNVEEGVALIAEAAEHHVAAALHDYAYSLEFGIGVSKDEQAAFSYYLQAAVQGDRDSLHSVARCFHEGVGVDPNEKTASQLYDLHEKLSKSH